MSEALRAPQADPSPRRRCSGRFLLLRPPPHAALPLAAHTDGPPSARVTGPRPTQPLCRPATGLLPLEKKGSRVSCPCCYPSPGPHPSNGGSQHTHLLPPHQCFACPRFQSPSVVLCLQGLEELPEPSFLLPPVLCLSSPVPLPSPPSLPSSLFQPLSSLWMSEAPGPHFKLSSRREPYDRNSESKPHVFIKQQDF